MIRVVTGLAVVLLTAGCGDDDASSSSQVGETPISTPGAAAVATEQAVAEATGTAGPEAEAVGQGLGEAAQEGGLRHREITSDLFLDTPEHRDPFAPFEVPKSAEPTEQGTTEPIMPLATPERVVFADRELEDLQCRMILAMRGEKPRAYLLGPETENAYVMQGEYAGRAIRGGANEPEVHWRVYEIQEGGVSFELSSSTAQEGDTGVRPALRLYNEEEMRKFENLFSLR